MGVTKCGVLQQSRTCYFRGNALPVSGPLFEQVLDRVAIVSDLVYFFFSGCFFSIFAQVSFNATVRLKTGLPGLESRSTQKYPSRSN